MTETVVTHKDNTVVAQPDNLGTVVAQATMRQTIVTGMMGPPGAATLNQLRDLDLTELVSGSTLVYNTQTQKWTATTLLDQQIIESGQF
jgi:hypothetical protein